MTRRTSNQPGRKPRRNRLERWLATGAVLAVFAGLAAYAWIGREANPAGSTAADGQKLLPPFWQAEASQVQEIRVEYPGEPERQALVAVRSQDNGQNTADTAVGRQPAAQSGSADQSVSQVAYAPVSRFQGIAKVPFATYRTPERDVDWLLQSPLNAPADGDTLDRLARTLAEPVPQAEVRSANELEADADQEAQDSVLATYGLDKPRAVVRVRLVEGKDGKEGQVVEQEIRVGNPTPITAWADTPAGYYVYTPARPGIFTLSAYDLDPLLGEAASLRDLQVSEFETARVRRIRILWDDSPAQRAVAIEAEKLSGLSAAGNPETRWQLLTPQTLPADSTRVQAILADLANLRAQMVVDEGNLAEYGLDNPRGEVIVWLDEGQTSGNASGAGETANTQAVPLAYVLHIGDTSPDGSVVYARAADDPTVYAVDAWRLESVRSNGDNWFGLVTRLILPSDWGWGQDLGTRLQEIVWTAQGHEYRLVAQSHQSWQVLADGQAKQTPSADSPKLGRLWSALSSLRFDRVTQVGGSGQTPGATTASTQLAKVRLLPRPTDRATGATAASASASLLPVEIVPVPASAGQADALSVLLQVTGEGFTRRGEMAQATWQELVDALGDLVPPSQND